MRILIIFSLIVFVFGKLENKPKHTKEKKTEKVLPTVKESDEKSQQKKFLELIEKKRNEHAAAIRSIVDIEDKSKQRLFVEDVLKNIKKLVTDNQDIVVRIGHPAEAPFPHDSETLKEALLKLFENISFFSDLALRFPKIAERTMKNDRKFKSSVIWCYQYVSKTNLIDDKTSKVLTQMAKQLNFIKSDEIFINPFDKEEAKKKVDFEHQEKERKRKEIKNKLKKDGKQKKSEKKKVEKEDL